MGCATEGAEQVCVQMDVQEKLTYFSRILTKLVIPFLCGLLAWCCVVDGGLFVCLLGFFFVCFPPNWHIGLGDFTESLTHARSLKMMDKFGGPFGDIQ